MPAAVRPHENAAEEREARSIARRAVTVIDDSLARAPLAPGPVSITPAPAATGDRVPPALTTPLESLLQTDLSGVRLHTDAGAAAASHALRAHAFTVGRDVFFGHGRYRPETPVGRQLIAHEFTHVAQQARGGGARLQRSPYDVPGADPGLAAGSEDIHGKLGEAYTGDLNMPNMGAVQYTEGYQRWLQSSTATNVSWSPPTFRQHSPLDRLGNGLPTGYTDLTVNGVSINPPNTNAPAYLAALQGQLTPAGVAFSPGLVTGQVACRFDPSFKVQTSTIVDELTVPPQGGWTAKMAPGLVGGGAACAGKASVPVTLALNPNEPRYDQLVHDSEMEHVADLQVMHNRHLVPYYHFVTSLSATAGDNATCETFLRRRLGDRVQQATFGFLLGDVAEARKHDTTTHQSVLTPNVAPQCSSVTLTPSQTAPQQPGMGPGNVQAVAPVKTAVNINALSVKGGALMDGPNVLKTFRTAADANSAMAIMVSLGVTEIQRIGPMEILMSNGQIASGLLTGIAGRDIDPSRYQVTLGGAGGADWVISQVDGTTLFELVNFAAARDDAFSAVGLLRANKAVRQSWFGAANAPQMTFFTA